VKTAPTPMKRPTSVMTAITLAKLAMGHTSMTVLLVKTFT
jgi:hypothetical protein